MYDPVSRDIGDSFLQESIQPHVQSAVICEPSSVPGIPNSGTDQWSSSPSSSESSGRTVTRSFQRRVRSAEQRCTKEGIDCYWGEERGQGGITLEGPSERSPEVREEGGAWGMGRAPGHGAGAFIQQILIQSPLHARCCTWC